MLWQVATLETHKEGHSKHGYSNLSCTLLRSLCSSGDRILAWAGDWVPCSPRGITVLQAPAASSLYLHFRNIVYLNRLPGSRSTCSTLWPALALPLPRTAVRGP
eukprot:scaffold2065_cov359-Prasinococcus_capsulatus_cf.AAC.4